MLAWTKYQLQLFALSMSFFTRVPVPMVPYSSQRMNQANRYFALVGAVIGGLCAGVFWLTSQFFPLSLAVLLTMILSLLLTGAFHEDGLADMADGIGGGYTVEKRLAIMKDSRLGTYGSATLCLALLGKFLLLYELCQVTSLPYILIAGYTFSRACSISLVHDMFYVSELNTSKSRHLTEKKLTPGEMAFILVCGVFSLAGFDVTLIVPLILMAVMLRFAIKRWLNARLGGYTGDCLGGVQQLFELGMYLVILGYYY